MARLSLEEDRPLIEIAEAFSASATWLWDLGLGLFFWDLKLFAANALSSGISQHSPAVYGYDLTCEVFHLTSFSYLKTLSQELI
jgi:hypothetical protein